MIQVDRVSGYAFVSRSNTQSGMYIPRTLPKIMFARDVCKGIDNPSVLNDRRDFPDVLSEPPSCSELV